MGHDIVKRSPFSALLRQYRLAAALSQEALAERAALSTRGISNLERGLRRRPHLTTVALLADALALSPGDRAAFVAAARDAPPSITPEAITEPPHAEASASSEEGGASAASPALPAAPPDLVGRATELAAARDLLWQGKTRLLTLTGPGGVGKTHLALALAAESRAHYADGVVFVALAPVRDPVLVASLVARALGVQESDERPVADLVAARLRERRLLLVLDNFEHVAAAAPLVAALLAACPSLAVLVTSRAAVRVRGERELPVPPLALPAAPSPGSTGTPVSPESLWEYAATDLFVRRARVVRPLFAPTVADAPAIAAICRRLDGLPLAIELAAARIKLLSPLALLDRLDKRLPLLVGGARDLPERQQTMRAAIAWSYDLLHPGEQALFRRLAVFQGGAALDAVENVCGPAGDESDGEEGGNDLAGDMLLWLESLVDQSLLQREESPDGEPRVTMLETIREYAAERLVSAGEEPRLRARHAAHYLALAEEAEPRLIGADQADWLGRLDEEHDNLRAALRWARETGAVETGLRLAAALWRFWSAHNYLSEGRRWLRQALEQGGTAPQALHAKALNAAGALALVQGDFSAAQRLFEQNLAIERERGDRRSIARALANLGHTLSSQGLLTQARSCVEESLALFQILEDERGIANCLETLRLIASLEGEYSQACTYGMEVLNLHRAHGDTQSIAIASASLGRMLWCAGNNGRARALIEDSLVLLTALDNTWAVASTLVNLGDVLRRLGEVEQAWDAYARALAMFRETEHSYGIAATLIGLAAVAATQGRGERSARLRGAAEALGTAPEQSLNPAERDDIAHAEAYARAKTGDAAYDAARAVGAALPLDHAIAYALGDAP